MIDNRKIEQNLNVVSQMVHGAGCSLMIVTKSFCAHLQIIDLLLAHPGVDYLADSRIYNIKTYAKKARAAGMLTPHKAVI